MKRPVLLCLLLFAVTFLRAKGGDPAPPGDLKVTQSPGTAPCVLMSWSGDETARYFKIYRSVDSANQFPLIGFSPVPFFADFDVEPAKTYAYAVTVVDTQMHESAKSATATITVTGTSSGEQGWIAGTVIDDSTGVGIPDLRVRFFSLADSIPWLHSALTDSLGMYSTALDTGDYFVQTGPLLLDSSQPYLPQWYDNASGPTTATEVTVHQGDTVRIDFSLKRVAAVHLVTVRGTVSDKLGVPIPGCAVAFLRSIQDLQELAAESGSIPGLGDEYQHISGFGYAEGVLWVGMTNTQGEYNGLIPAGERVTPIAAAVGYLPTFANGQSDPTLATSLTLLGDTNVVNFVLPPTVAHANSLQGTTSGPGGQPITSRVILFPRPRRGSEIAPLAVGTSTNGDYSLDNLAPGGYSLLAVPYSGFAPGYYKGGSSTVPHWEEGDSIAVSGSTTGLSMVVRPVQSTGLATVKGIVKAKDTGLGVPGVFVSIRTSDSTVLGWSMSNDDGSYQIDLVNSGPAVVSFDRPGYTGYDIALDIQPGPALQEVGATLQPLDPLSVGLPLLPSGTPHLYENFPNPFNPSTTIQYYLPSQLNVRLAIYDLLGRQVAVLVQGRQAQGVHRVVWDAAGLSSGTYFYQLSVGSYRSTKSLIILR